MLVVSLFLGSESLGAQISLRPTATPRSTIVRLGDVADIRADDGEQARRLAALPLLPSPAPGTKRFLTSREVQDMLAAQGEDLAKLQFIGSLKSEIRSGRREARGEERSKRQAALLAGKLSSSDVSFRKQQQAPKPVEEIKKQPQQPVILAVRAIARGEIITAASLDLQYVDKVPGASASRVPIRTREALIGKEAVRPISKGKVIFSNQARAPLLVKRGEVVEVIARGGGIRVRTRAKVSQDGAAGDLVTVESLTTRERYDARVVGLRRLEIFAGGAFSEDPSRPTALTKDSSSSNRVR